jgi:hypothetical protein
MDWFSRLMKALRHAPSMRTIALIFVGLIVLFVVVHTLVASRARRNEEATGARRRQAGTLEDPWRAAEALAAENRHEEAAHALYRGVLLSLSRLERLRLDPSRTSGDYARELRRRGSASAVMFRSFTRRFESAVYGHERMTPDVYAELLALSEPFRPRARAA